MLSGGVEGREGTRLVEKWRSSAGRAVTYLRHSKTEMKLG